MRTGVSACMETSAMCARTGRLKGHRWADAILLRCARRAFAKHILKAFLMEHKADGQDDRSRECLNEIAIERQLVDTCAEEMDAALDPLELRRCHALRRPGLRRSRALKPWVAAMALAWTQ